jgi:hypothetical protein
MSLAINQQPLAGVGHQVGADLRLLESIKSGLEQIRMELGKNTPFIDLAASIDISIAEASRQIIGSDDALMMFV